MARQQAQPGPRYFAALDAFSGPIDGVPHSFNVGELVEAGSAPHRTWPHLFAPVEVHWKALPDVEPRIEEATARPGEVRS